MGFNCFKVAEQLRGHSLFFTTTSPGALDSFDRPQKNERLNQPWCYPVVLNPRSLDGEPLTNMSLVFSGGTETDQWNGMS